MSRFRPTHVRAVALSAVAVGLVVLPIAAAQAHPSQPGTASDQSGSANQQTADGAAGSLLNGVQPGQLTSRLLLTIGQLAGSGAQSASGSATPQAGASSSDQQTGATATTPEFCGPAASASAGEVTAQTCIEHYADGTYARAYVTNTSDRTQTVALNLTRTDGQVMQIQCTVTPGSRHSVCQTPSIPDSSAAGVTQDAVAEVVGQGEPVSAGVLHVETGQVALSELKSAQAGQ